MTIGSKREGHSCQKAIFRAITVIVNQVLWHEEKAIANRINKEVGYEGTPFVGDVLQDAGNVDLGLRSAKK